MNYTNKAEAINVSLRRQGSHHYILTHYGHKIRLGLFGDFWVGFWEDDEIPANVSVAPTPFQVLTNLLSDVTCQNLGLDSTDVGGFFWQVGFEVAREIAEAAIETI